MTLITRIIGKEKVLLCTDNQSNNANNQQNYLEDGKPKTISKGFDIENVIAGLSGFIGTENIHIPSILKTVENREAIPDLLAKRDDLQEYSKEQILGLLSEVDNESFNHLVLVGSLGATQYKERTSFNFPFNQGIAIAFANDTGSINQMETNYDPNSYSNAIDFNFSYVDPSVIATYPPFYYTLLHVILFEHLGENCLDSFLDLDTNDQISLIRAFYDRIDNLKYKNNLVARRILSVRSIGPCSLVQILHKDGRIESIDSNEG